MATPTKASDTISRAKQLFQSRFGSAPSIAASAPGRVNLIGEHTDYNDGFVMPLALSGKVCAVVGSKNTVGLIRIVTEAEPLHPYVEFGATKADVSASSDPKWANYVKGVILQFFEAEDFLSFDIAITTDVPLGGGLSSSAALEVATFTFLEGVTGNSRDKRQKALLCQKAENVTVGMPCGIMDQFISVLGLAGNALLLDCRSQITRLIPLSDPSVVLLVCNSNVKHELTGGEYAQRRAQCYEAVDVLKAAFPTNKITALRDVNLEQLESVKSKLTDVVFRRARHVIGENNRTTQAADALSRGDYTSVGKLMNESHNSLRDDYEVSCAELDYLVEAARTVPGVFGSRMTGGGFGGCTITMLKQDSLANAIQEISSRYTQATGKTATIFSTVPGDGARVVP